MNYTQTKKHTAAMASLRKRAKWARRGVRKDVNVGDVVEGCDLHIGHVLEVNRENGDVVIQSLFTGKVGNCDLYHCGIVVQTTKQIIQKLDLWNTGGKPAISKLWEERCRKGTY